MYFDKNAQHFQPTLSGTSESYTFVANFVVNIQPANAESTVVVNGVYGRTFKAFMTYSGLNIEDHVTISGTNNTYRVKAVSPYNYGALQHYEAIMTLPEEA